MKEARSISAASGVSESEVIRLAEAVADKLSKEYEGEACAIKAVSDDSNVAIAGYMMVSEVEKKMAMMCLTQPRTMANLVNVVYDRF